MKALEDMCEVLEEQVKKISMKGDSISPQELDNAYKAVDIIKDIKTIEAMKKAEEQGMFEGRSYDGGNSMDYSYGSMRRPYPHMMYPIYDGSYDDMGRSVMQDAVGMQITTDVTVKIIVSVEDVIQGLEDM